MHMAGRGRGTALHAHHGARWSCPHIAESRRPFGTGRGDWAHGSARRARRQRRADAPCCPLGRRRRVGPGARCWSSRSSVPPETRWSRSRWRARSSCRSSPARRAPRSRSTCWSPWRRSRCWRPSSGRRSTASPTAAGSRSGSRMLARAALAITLARHINSLYLYPLALGSLVLSRAFGVARSAVVPRVLPEGSTLVKVNSRVTLTGVIAGLIVAPLGFGIAKVVGYPWMLRVGARGLRRRAVPRLGAAVARRQRRRGEAGAVGRPGGGLAEHPGGRVHRILGELPAALRSAAALRALVGFLTLFLAFRAREDGARPRRHRAARPRGGRRQRHRRVHRRPAQAGRSRRCCSSSA